SIPAAEPEATVQQTTKSTSSGHPVISLYSPELKPKSEPPGPGRTGLKIPFDTSPNGTGASASERVPASSGPPVPTPLPLTPELAKVPFHPPAEKPKAPPTKTEVAPLATKLEVASAPAKDETPITLSLKVVLQNLPRFQLNGDVCRVSRRPADVAAQADRDATGQRPSIDFARCFPSGVAGKTPRLI